MHFEPPRRPPKTPLQRAWRQVKYAWAHHWQQIEIHRAYVMAVARRSGYALWAGRGLLAVMLVRFRLTAFTSEVGESLRPLIAAWQVGLAYAVSWLYVSLDVLLRCVDEYALRGRTWRVVRTLLFFGVFHSVATMLLPAVMIHAAVHRSDQLLQLLARRVAREPSRWPRAVRVLPTLWWVPTLVGLTLIPLCPLFDEPIEKVLKGAFHATWPLPKAVERRKKSDYEIATSSSEQHPADAPHPPQLYPPPRNHEEPELVRAKGRGEPTYSPEGGIDAPQPEAAPAASAAS